MDEDTTRVPLNLDWLKICKSHLVPKRLADVVGPEALPFVLNPKALIEKSTAGMAAASDLGLTPYSDPALRDPRAGSPSRAAAVAKWGERDAAGLQRGHTLIGEKTLRGH